MISFIKLGIKGISYLENRGGSYTLMLNEIEGKRILPIVIGGSEAQSIAIALENKILPSRPLTHDLFKNLADDFLITIKHVVIHDLVDGIFFANLICEQNQKQHVIDSRVSDAVALAVRFKAPIFTYETILESSGIYLEEKRETDKHKSNLEQISKVGQKKEDYSLLSLGNLKKQLNQAVIDENYELAAKIRDHILKKYEK